MPRIYDYCPRCAAAFTRREIHGHERMVCPDCRFIFWQNPAVGVAVIVMRGEGDIVGAKKGALALEGQIAQLVGRRCTDQCDVRVQGAQVEPFLAVEFHQLNNICLRALVHAPALATGIKVGVHAQLREDAGALGRGLAQLVEDEAAGNVVGFDFVLVDHAPDRGRLHRRRARGE